MNQVIGPQKPGPRKPVVAPAVQNSRGIKYTIQWIQADGSPVGLTGATLSGAIYDPVVEERVAIDGTLLVVNDGTFTWELGANDVAKTGTFQLQFTAQIGAGQPFRSYPTPWVVHDDLNTFPPGSWTGSLIGVTPEAGAWLETAYSNTAGKDNTYVLKPDGQWYVELGGGPGGSVESVFGRTGHVIAVANDYSWAQINKAVSDLADLTTKNHGDLDGGGVNSHPTIDSHLASSGNPHNVTASQVAAVPLAGGTMTGVLDFSGTAHQGLSIIQLTEAQRDTLGVIPAGAIIFNTTTGNFQGYTGSIWVNLDQGGAGGAVDSVFGRTGNVVAVADDYTWAQINKAVSDLADLTTKNHSDLTGVGTYTHPGIDSHIDDELNPHSVSAAQTGALDLLGGTLAGVLDFSGTTHQGLIVLTLTTTQRDALGVVTAGSIIYNSTDDSFQGYESGGWVDLSTTPGDVSSVFGRTGDVIAQPDDYLWEQIDLTISDLADLTTKNHGDLAGVGTNDHPTIDTHLASAANPHSVTAVQAGAVPLEAILVAESTSFTLGASHRSALVRVTAMATVTLPDGLADGFQAIIANVGTGTVTLSATSTLNAKGTQLANQWGSAVVVHVGSNVWEAYGDLT